MMIARRAREMKDLYCMECGAKMVASELIFDTFGPRTGEKRQLVEMQCPKGKWWWRHHGSYALLPRAKPPDNREAIAHDNS